MRSPDVGKEHKMPPKLATYVTEERLVEYQEAFDTFDPDGKGKIPCEHLLVCLRKVGLMPADCELEDLLRSVDTENNIFAEGVSYDQFCQIASKKEKDVYNERDIINAFALFDSTSKGYLTTEELTQILCTRGDKLSEGEMAALIKTAGASTNGRIHYEDFIHRMMLRD
ncbi:unnamed protein product [Taenia asiatica]|uniref:Calmodulin n=1 Tax=Taenia asiatica TaxID=60517 RepID=A0A0R3WAY4_TAEAS|nr:unnamed protein product [Taenia asiatica]